MSACQEHSSDLKQLVDDFAKLECRAISLREKRFALANQIRFTQDSLALHTGKSDTLQYKLRLDQYNSEKNVVLQQSLSLADSIKRRLKEIMENELTQKDQKAKFDDLLNKTLQQKGCLDQTNSNK